jgi:type IV pilus assembly protein PilV
MKNENGVTMIELLVALALLSIGLLALFTLQSTAIQGNRDSKEMTTAVFLAEKKIEELKNTPFGSLSLGSTADSNNPITGSGTTGGIYSRSWNVQSFSGSANMKQITVIVSWTQSGQSHSAALDTIVSK